MNRGIYATGTGMLTSQRWLEVSANNLANANTTAFKRDGIQFNEMLERPMWSHGGMGAYLGTIATGAAPRGQYVDFGRGPIDDTANPLDLAIDSDEGMFAVETPAGVRYTRDGSFGLDTMRRLVSRDGFPVIDEEGRGIVVPEGQVTIKGNGEVTVGSQVLGTIAVFTGQFEKAGRSMFVSGDAQMQTAGSPSKPPVRQGAIESANINMVEEMTNMIRISRGFEMAQRAILTQDEMTQRLIQSLQNRS